MKTYQPYKTLKEKAQEVYISYILENNEIPERNKKHLHEHYKKNDYGYYEKQDKDNDIKYQLLSFVLETSYHFWPIFIFYLVLLVVIGPIIIYQKSKIKKELRKLLLGKNKSNLMQLQENLSNEVENMNLDPKLKTYIKQELYDYKQKNKHVFAKLDFSKGGKQLSEYAKTNLLDKRIDNHPIIESKEKINSNAIIFNKNHTQKLDGIFSMLQQKNRVDDYFISKNPDFLYYNNLLEVEALAQSITIHKQEINKIDKIINKKRKDPKLVIGFRIFFMSLIPVILYYFSHYGIYQKYIFLVLALCIACILAACFVEPFNDNIEDEKDKHKEEFIKNLLSTDYKIMLIESKKNLVKTLITYENPEALVYKNFLIEEINKIEKNNTLETPIKRLNKYGFVERLIALKEKPFKPSQNLDIKQDELNNDMNKIDFYKNKETLDKF